LLWLLVSACLAAPVWAQSSARSLGPEPPAFRLAGSEQVAYIVLPDRVDKTAVFDVLRRRTGQEWKRITPEPLTGTPMLAVAVGGELHIFFSPMLYGVLKADGSEMSMQIDPSAPVGVGGSSGVGWPPGTRPRAACEAVGFAGVSAPTLLAVVPLPAGWGGESSSNHRGTEDAEDVPAPASREAAESEPSTEPAGVTESSPASVPTTRPGNWTRGGAVATSTQPGAAVREELALFQLVESRWVYRGHVTAAPVGRDTRVHLAAVDGTAYVLIDQGRRGKQLWAVHPNSPAREVELPEAIRDSQPLAMLGMEKTLTLLTAATETEEDAEEDDAETAETAPVFRPTVGELSVRIWLYDGVAFGHNVVHTAKGPMTWPAGELPQVVRWGDYMQMVWGRTQKELRSARLDPSGLMTEPADIDAMSQPNPRAALGVLNGYMMGAMAAVILLTLFSKPSGPPKPFSLPPHMQPGRLGRRLVATMLDLLPCQAIGMAIAGWDQAAEGFQAIGHQMQLAAGNNAAYTAVMIAASLLLVYSTLAEWKTGATLGKRVMGLCVVGDEGRPLTARTVALRNVMKVLELFWVMFPLALIFPVITRYRQRLGDVFARTAVIDRASLEPPPTLPTEEDDAQTR